MTGFWADTFDADLLAVVPGADRVLGEVTVPLWTFGGTTNGRLNHPSFEVKRPPAESLFPRTA